jgi:hypothetical protein
MRTEKFKEELIKLSLRELKGQDIVAESETMHQVLRVAFKLSKLEASNIILLGESGTGKGLLAKFIHPSSYRLPIAICFAIQPDWKKSKEDNHVIQTFKSCFGIAGHRNFRPLRLSPKLQGGGNPDRCSVHVP